jgi:hypothetical protein
MKGPLFSIAGPLCDRTTLIRFVSNVLHSLRYERAAGTGLGGDVRVKIALLLMAALVSASSQSLHEVAPATLVEAVEYEPCDYYCGPFNHPTTAYCVYADGQILVGERAGLLWFGESDVASMRDLAGSQITARFDQSSIWIGKSGQRTIRIRRGSNYEQFKDTRCLVEVHKPKLAIAAGAERPLSVPADAFPLAGEQRGNIQNRSVFVWFSCTLSPTLSTVDCRKWYPNGASRGVERYCGRTVDGVSIPPDFSIDHVASRERQIILKSGAVLQFDHRGRINDKLAHAGEACY